VKKIYLLAGIAAIAFFIYMDTETAHADLVYDNGPIAGNLGAWEIDDLAGPTYFISDSFTVSAPVNLTSVTAGLWVSTGDTPTSLEWQIGTVSAGSQIASGTSSLANTLWGPAGGGNNSFTVYESSFTVTGTLEPGTYYLTLEDAQATGNSSVDWDDNNGPSSELVYFDGHTIAPGSESFQVYATAVPEPSTATLIIGALILLPFGTRTRRIMRKQIKI
jgi:hypothetical protein